MRVIDYMNPFSEKFHACQSFGKLKGKYQAATVITVALVSLLTVGIGSVAVFRLLVNRFTKLDRKGIKSHESTAGKTDDAKNAVLGKDKEKSLGKDKEKSTEIKTEPVKPEPVKSETFKPEPIKTEPKQETAKPQPFSPKDHILSLNRKAKANSSDRTVKMRSYLSQELAKAGKKFLETKDDGDCFFDAVAQGLTILEKKPYSVKDVRQACADYIEALEKGPLENNWVISALKSGSLGENYESFKEKVRYTTEEMDAKGLGAPVWGDALAAKIISKVFNVKVSTHTVNVYQADQTEADFIDQVQNALKEKRFINNLTHTITEPYEEEVEQTYWNPETEEYESYGFETITKYKDVKVNAAELITVLEIENPTVYDEREDKSDSKREIGVASYQADFDGHALAIVDKNF